MEKGTQGKVTRCLREGRVVWIKTPHPSQERSFLREVDIVKDLTDRHIIQYYSYSIEKLELVMEDAEGGNLQSAIPKLPWEHKERIAGEIAHGISYIHSLGIVHCDIKSPNILLTRSLVVKLCDFGSARVVTNNKDKTPCSGTPGWMAPEWLQDATAYSPKSDIYALGIVMWEMASGDEPCNRSQVLEERLEDVPVEYQGIMQDCWSLEPERRPDARAISIMKYGRDSKQAVEYMMRLAMGDADVVSNIRDTLDESVPAAERSMQEDTHAEDLNELRLRYLKNPDTLKDDGPIAVEFWRESANKGCEEAKAAMAFHYNESGLYDEALDYAQQVSLHPVARYVLGNLYSKGHGVEKNEGEARICHHEAAKSGFSVSQVHMGLGCFKVGLHAEALEWYRKAAKAGNPAGQYLSGMMIYYGHGVPPDPREGALWIGKAADQGYMNAVTGMGIICRNQKEYADAMEWFKKAPEDRIAQYNIGHMYYSGWGVEPNYTTAKEWFQRAADLKYGEAEYAIGTMYHYGRGETKDLDKAIDWYKKAMRHGAQDAVIELYVALSEANRRGKVQVCNRILKDALSQGHPLGEANILLRDM